MLVIRHGEIFTKSEPVRKQFARLLFDNIKTALPDSKVSLKRWRIYVESSHEDKDVEVLQHVFGIVSISKAVKTEATLESIQETALSVVPDVKTFGVHSQRISKEFPMNSQELSGEVGYYILQNKKGLKVNLTNPDFWVNIELYDKVAYVVSKTFDGPGGLPVGSARGTVLCDYANENDSIAALMMLKRGANVTKHASIVGWDFGNRPEEIYLAKVTGTSDVEEFIKAQSESDIPVFSPLIGFSEKEIGSLKKFYK